MVTPRPNPPESLTERLEFLEQENATLRHRLLVDDLSDEVRDRVFNWLKGIGAFALAGATALGLGSFAALSSIATNQTKKVATDIAKEEAQKIPLTELTQEVSKQLVEDLQQDSEFKAQLIQLLAQNPDLLQQVAGSTIQNESLQGRLQTEIETIAKATLIETATQATQAAQQTADQPTEKAAAAIANAAKQEVEDQRFYVVLKAADNVETLAEIAQTIQGQNRGWQTQTCGPKPDSQQSALVLSDRDSFLLNKTDADKLVSQATTTSSETYAVLQGRAFFACS